MSEIEKRLEEIKAKGEILADIDGVTYRYTPYQMSDDINWLITELEQSLKREAELVAALEFYLKWSKQTVLRDHGITESKVRCKAEEALAAHRASIGKGET